MRMSWDITLLTVHILLAMGAGRLFCTAPDWMQKLVLFNVIVAALGLVGCYALQLFRIDFDYLLELKVASLSVEHIAVLLYIGRLILVENELCKNSLPRSRPSPG
jgi:uncharacterized membrane protein